MVPLALPPNSPCLAHDGWEAFRWEGTLKNESFYFLLVFLLKETHAVSRPSSRSGGGGNCLYLERREATSCLQAKLRAGSPQPSPGVLARHVDGAWHPRPTGPASPWMSAQSLVSIGRQTRSAWPSELFRPGPLEPGRPHAPARPVPLLLPPLGLPFPPSPSSLLSAPSQLSTHQSPPGPLQCPAPHLLWEVFPDAPQVHAGV